MLTCLAYCLTWELAGPRAASAWGGIREYADADGGLGERSRWMAELYEESPPSAQEERSLMRRLEPMLQTGREVKRLRDELLALLPEAMRESAAGHSLMRPLSVPSEYNKLKAWLLGKQVSAQRLRIVGETSLAEREVEFERFLEQPFFLEGFRRFWRHPPKFRTNRQTRVLLTLAAALSQMIELEQVADFSMWKKRLAEDCHFTDQTQDDLSYLVEHMADFSYDPQELAYRLFVDAKDADKRNLRGFMEHYSKELSAFCADFRKGMEYGVA